MVDMFRKPYPSDINDEEWNFVASAFNVAKIQRAQILDFAQ